MSELESLRTKMNKIQIRGKTAMSEVDLIIHILSNLRSQAGETVELTGEPGDGEEVELLRSSPLEERTQN